MNEITAKQVELAAAGDQAAITELYERTYSSVYKTVRAMVRDEDTVLDIVQDSYIKGFQSLDQLDAPENFQAWMKRIATNKTKDHLKRKKPILFSEMASEDGEEIDFQDDRLEHCPEEVIDQQETTRLMNEILGTLSEDQRLVIGMFYYEEMTVREIAEVLGCSENTVKSRLNYGRKKVEVKVRELEKKGTKLYSLAPLPFLLWLFRMYAQAAEIPSVAVWDAVTTACTRSASTAGAGTAGTSAAGTGAKAAATAGTKVLATKIIAGVLAVAVVGGGAAAAIFSNGRREDAASADYSVAGEVIPEASTGETIPNAVTAEEAYQTVVDNYRTAIDMDSGAYLAAYEAGALDGIYNGDHQAIRYYHMGHSHNFFTARKDLDGNGVEELLIGIGTTADPQAIRIVDVYSFDGTRAVQVVDEPTLGDRSQLTILEDWTFYLIGGSGADSSSYEYFKLQNCVLVGAAPSSAPECQFDWQLMAGQESAAARIAYEEVLREIRSACAESDDAWIYGGASENYRYANLEAMFFRHLDMEGPKNAFFAAYRDIDGNGVEELCIGSGLDTESAYLVGVYAFDGREAVTLCDTLFELLTDGTVLLTGNGVGVERVTQIGPDGYTLEDVSSDIAPGDDLFSLDFASHGGKLILNWDYLCG